MKHPNRAARALSLLLAAVLVLLSASCAKNGEKNAADPGNTPAVTEPDAADAGSDPAGTPETEPARPLEYLGAHDFEGRTYTVLVSGMDNS
ncbi:MAG: hypothetical protein II557_05090, partial [Clostridia bacterium]|nr:hypothetical protein [Clostridia bacterium]